MTVTNTSKKFENSVKFLFYVIKGSQDLLEIESLDLWHIHQKL